MAAPLEGRGFGANLIATTGSTAGKVLLGFAASVVVTRTLGPAGRGEFSFVLTTLGIRGMRGGAGSFAAGTSASARHGRGVAELYPASAAVATLLSLAFGACFVFAYFALSGSLFSGVGKLAVCAVVIALVPTLVLNYWTAVMAIDDRLFSFSVGTLVGSALYLLGVSVAAVAGVLSTGTALVLWMIGSLAPLATVARLRRLRPVPGQKVMTRELLRHAARANLGDIAMLLVLRADVLAVKGYRGFTEVGIYAVATGVAELVLQAGISLRLVFLRKQGQATEREALVAMLVRSTRLLLAGGLVAVAVVALVAGPLVTTVFGPSFSGAGLAAAILAPGVLAVALQGPLRDFLLVEGGTAVPSATAVATLILNVLLNVLLLPHHSYLVAAMTSTLAYVTNFAVCVWCFSRVTGTPIRRLLVPVRSDLSELRGLIRARG